VHPGDLSGAQGPGKGREGQFDFVLYPDFSGDIHGRENGLIRVGLHTHGAHAGALNIEMGKIHRVVFITAGGDIAKGLGIEHFPAADGGAADFAGSRAAIQTGNTDTGPGGGFHSVFG
jgi:hypothetical protein